MRVIYAGGPLCSEATFKRLLVLANEVGFSDRPSLGFGRWGTVGVPSPLRQLPPEVQNGPIAFRFHSPPESVTAVYRPFIERDIPDLRLRGLVLDGLAHDPVFRERTMPSEAQYGIYSGAEIVAALTADATLRGIDLGEIGGFGEAFDVSSPTGRRDTLRPLLMDTSIHITSAILATQELDLVPVADSPTMARLLALRVAAPEAMSSSLATALGFEIMRAVVPDEALGRLGVRDLMEFRHKTKDVYVAWGAEVARLSAMIDDGPVADELGARVRKLVATEVKPKMDLYRAELASARDALFGDVIKSVVDWKLPTLAVAVLHHDPLLAGALAVLGNVAQAGAKMVTDQTVSRRGIARKHGMAYLVQLADRTEAG
jgi:hypothetical protein